MALRKSKIRSIRFSEEMDDLINQQIGDTFTAKFERLVYNCYMLASEREKEIQRLDEEIKKRKEALELLRKDFLVYSGKAKRLSVT